MKIFYFKSCLLFISACLFLFSVQLFVIPSFSYGEIFIVANKSIATDTISADDVQKIFLGNKTKLDNTTISFVIQKPGDSHTDFLKTYIKRSTAQFKNYWRQMVFSGKGRTPKSFESEEELITYISEHEGVISYVSQTPSNNNVKIIRVE